MPNKIFRFNHFMPMKLEITSEEFKDRTELKKKKPFVASCSNYKMKKSKLFLNSNRFAKKLKFARQAMKLRYISSCFRKGIKWRKNFF